MRIRAALTIGAVALVLIVSCSKDDDPVRPKASPIEDPTLVVERFRRAWVNRDTLALDSALTSTFGYGYGCLDSVGDLHVVLGPYRDSVQIAARRLFHLGSPSYPPATAISVTLDDFQISEDPNDPVHQKIAFCDATVTVRTPQDTLHLGGFAGFGLMRGDLAPGTSPPDSTRWWISSAIEIVFVGRVPVPSPARRREALRRLAESLARNPVHMSSAVVDSTDCDSLLTVQWSYALRRYLE